MAISWRGRSSTIRSDTAPTIASAARSLEKSSFTLSFLPAPILYPTIGMQPAAIPTTMDMTIWKNFMTIPTTAIGIWAYCSSPKILSKDPYFLTILLMAAMAATSEIWERKLVMPKTRVLEQVPFERMKSFFPGFTNFMWRIYQMARMAVRTCPSTVATAAPIIPQRNMKMNIGSRIILRMAPESVDTMAKRGLPSERITGFRHCPNM